MVLATLTILTYSACPAEDWATFSDEYVMVENEYEDIGREILGGQDLKVDLDEKAVSSNARGMQECGNAETLTLLLICDASQATHRIKEHASTVDADVDVVDGSVEIRDVVIDTSSPSHGKVALESVDSPAQTELEGDTQMPAREVLPATKNDNWLVDERRQWISDDNRLEELLGICYKSFSCGSVALFVPTPFGDYIAFHEGCPHYYLSDESVAASKKDDRQVKLDLIMIY